MRTIDSDAHVIETDLSWDHMEPADARYRPLLVSSPSQPDTGYWLVDGESWGVARLGVRDYKEMSALAGRDMNAPEAARDMGDVALRLRHLDELGIDLQVLYPTLFLSYNSDKPAVDIALCRGYNRWLGSIWKQSNKRLLWAVVPPLSSIPDALDEIRWAKEHGACGVFMRCLEGKRVLQDPYFYPVYEEAQRLNIPITVHISNSNRDMVNTLAQHVKGTGNFWILRLSLVGAFHNLALSEVPQLFPRLRIGFIEGTAQWLPLVINDLIRRQPTFGKKADGNVLERNRFYVACQTDDDLPYIMDRVGENHLVIGTDYGHNDQASEIGALRILRSSGKITEQQYRKFTDDNAATFYGL